MRKTVLITGGSRGLGRACALKFAQLDYNVIINYNNSLKEAVSLEAYLKENYNISVLLVKADISKEDEVINMKNGIRNEKNIIKIPLSTIKDAKNYYKEYYNILIKKQEKPSDKEIIKRTKLNKKQIELIKKIPTEIISVEKTIDDNENLTMNDIIYNNENYNEFENIEETEKLLSIINNISKDENMKNILLMYWGINQKRPMTMEEIGNIYNISRQAISKKIKKIVKQIKKYY